MIERGSIVTAAYAAAGLIGGSLLSAAPLAAPIGRLSGPLRILAMTSSIAAGVAWGLFFALLAHRSLDEYQRERARRATYWGTAGGIAASAPLYAFVVMGGLHRIDSAIHMGKPLAVAFAGGYGLALLSVMAGVTIAAALMRRVRVSGAA